MKSSQYSNEYYDVFRELEVIKPLDRRQYRRRLNDNIMHVLELSERAPALIYILQDDYFIWVNKAFTEITGFDRQEIMATKAWGFIHPDDREMVRMHFDERLDGIAIPSYELRILNKKGGYIWGYLSADRILYQQKHAVMGIVIDVTQSREAQQALRASEDKLAKAFAASPNLMAISSLDEGRYIEVNEQFSVLTGYSREEALGKTVSELRIWADSDERIKLVDAIRKNSSVRNLEIMLRTKQGQLMEGLVSSELIKLNREDCMISIFTDMTEQKRLSREMARIDQMNIIGEIAATIGHEIRNPLTSVRGFLQYFSDIEVMEDYQEFFGIMIEELDRANQIITEFLSLAKNKRIDLRRNNLNDIIIAISPLIRADSLNQEKYLDISLNDIPDIMLDGNEIRQLILNLIFNGLDAMEKGTTIHLHTALDDNGDVLLIVEDEGTGISNAVLPNIFTPFFTTKESGTGLGLAVCYSIAVRHQAFIQVDTDNSGTRFTVRFNQT
ncbi:MAG: PAS domain S-box protein [Deltaproteobacteria bacterium]